MTASAIVPVCSRHLASAAISSPLIDIDMFLDQRPLEAREGDVCFVDAPQSRNPDFLKQLLKINRLFLLSVFFYYCNNRLG